MKLTIIAVGKLKEGWIVDGVGEYTKRLARFGRLDILEVPDEAVQDKTSKKVLQQAVYREGQRMLARWPKDAWAIALDSKGKSVGSEGLAKIIESKALEGRSHLVFAVGGSHGLSPSVLERCQFRLSFGPNTFPHQLFRVILLEQVYRAFKIRAGEAYHK